MKTMIKIDCPWCEAPLALDALETVVHCDGCSIEVELAADDVTHEVRRAA
jgi:sarcosine oxidase delta subunit